jgi:hypothetical protein
MESSAPEAFKPDGRPLHAYKLDDKAFARLEAVVSQNLHANRFQSAAADFVLWAAERYRRDYDGGALSWDFVTGPLNVHLSQEQLRELTAEGLKRLGRRVLRGGIGTQYLRAIAAEGGIPVRLLSGQSGNYRAALVGLVADVSRIGLGCPRDVALGFAQQRTRRLPKGYRSREFHELFVDFGFEILELRQLAPEGLRPQDVEPFLDREKPGWRDALSLRLDGEAARSLLADAVLVSSRHGLVTDPLTRVLRRGDGDRWSEWLDVEEASEIAPQLVTEVEPDRRRLRLGPVGALATAAPDLLFALERDNPNGPWSCRRISGRRTARFRFSLGVAAELMAMADGSFFGRVRLSGGEMIDPCDGPTFWRLEEMGESSAVALSYAGNAALRTRDPHVWMLSVDGKVPQTTGTLSVEPDGSVEGGALWRLSGKGRVLVPGGNAAVETGAEADDRDEIQASGPRQYRILDSRGAPVHRGVPAILYRHAGRSFRELTGRDLRHRVVGEGMGWKPGAPSASTLGRVAFAVRDGDGVGARVTVAMVPQAFSVRDATRGADSVRRLRFEGVPAGWVLRVAGGAPRQPDADGVVEVELEGPMRAQARLPLTLASPAGATPMAWSLDMPRARGGFQREDGESLAQNINIAMDDLRAWRVVPAAGRRTDLEIRLRGPVAGDVPTIGKLVTVEQPLSAFRPLLEEVLVAGGPDSELRLRVVTDGDPSPRLRLRHALGETRLDGDDVLVMQGETPAYDPSLEITAVDLSDPTRIEETGARGLSHLGSGRWFLLPRRNGKVMRPPRPLVRPKPSEAIGADAPRRADRVANYARHLRADVIDADLSRIARLVELLLENGVSPSTLDEVLALRRAPSAAVRLLMKVAPADLEDMLSLEVHGGPRWSFVSPEEWAQGFAEELASLRAQVSASPALAATADNVARNAVVERAADILRLRPALQGHVAMALIQAEPAALGDLAMRLGGLSAGLQDPARVLLETAQKVVARQSANTPRLHDLVARSRPPGCGGFHENIQGLIDAPLVVAEIAFRRRPMPTTREQIDLLRAVQADQAGYEAAMPAAMAWIARHAD